jgi:hypothetical protein
MLRSCTLCWLALAALCDPASAVPVPFEQGRLALQFGPLYGLEVPADAEVGASGVAEIQTSAGGQITRIEIPAGVFVADSVSIPLDDQTQLGFMPPIGGARLTFANDAGSFSRVATASGERLQGVMPLAGFNKFCVFFVACGATPSAILSVPLSVVGQGGTTTVAFVPSVTLEGAPWSTGTVTLDGADSTTEMIAGTVQTGASTTLVRLVTPVFLSTNTTGTYPATRGLGVLPSCCVRCPSQPPLRCSAPQWRRYSQSVGSGRESRKLV